MKSTIKSMLALMAGAMVFTACSNDDEFENINEQNLSVLKPMTFYASMEGQGDATRTAIDGFDINWSSGDKITIFDGVQDENYSFAHQFTLSSGVGSTSASFSGEAADASIYYALYPSVTSIAKEVTLTTDEEVVNALGSISIYFFQNYREIWEKSPDKASRYKETLDECGISSEDQAEIINYFKTGEFKTISKSGVQRNSSDQFENVVIPATQTATPGTADPKAMLMIAQSDDAYSLQFKNVCAYVKVTPKFDCHAITITSNGSENLAGTVTLNYNEGKPTTTVTANGSNKVELIGTITAGNTYYIAVRPETLASGFTIEFLTAESDHFYARSTTKKYEFIRNKVTNLGEFDTSGSWTVNTPTSGDDGNGREWVMLSPTMKVALTTAGVGDRFNVEGKWGPYWVLPAVDDFKPFLHETSSWDGTRKVLTVYGLGAWSDISCEIEITTSTYVWTSVTEGTSRKNISVTQKGVFINTGGNDEFTILYKYIGE